MDQVHGKEVGGIGPEQSPMAATTLETMKNDAFAPLVFTTTEGERVELKADIIMQQIQNLYEALFASGACNYSMRDDSLMPAYQAAVVAACLKLQA